MVMPCGRSSVDNEPPGTLLGHVHRKIGISLPVSSPMKQLAAYPSDATSLGCRLGVVPRVRHTDDMCQLCGAGAFNMRTGASWGRAPTWSLALLLIPP
jgi:hypothetical protein